MLDDEAAGEDEPPEMVRTHPPMIGRSAGAARRLCRSRAVVVHVARPAAIEPDGDGVEEHFIPGDLTDQDEVVVTAERWLALRLSGS